MREFVTRRLKKSATVKKMGLHPVKKLVSRVLTRFRESDLFHQCRRNFYETQTFISLPFAFTMPLATSASVYIIGQKKTPITHVKPLQSWKKFNCFKMGMLHLVVLRLITMPLLVLMKV